jgi:hypothetical protein
MNLAGMLLSQSDDQEPKILPEAAIARLREAATRYAEMYNNGPRFKVGDIVTPIADSTLRGAGEPYLVIATLTRAEHEKCSGVDCGSTQFMPWTDIRAICISHGDIAPFWSESANFEYWKEPTS